MSDSATPQTDSSPPGSPVPGILQVRTLEWVAIAFSGLVTQLCPTLFLCSWGFSTQESWSGLLCLSPEDLPNSVIKPRATSLQEDSLLSEPAGKPKNTGAGSLSLLQGIVPTQKSNWGLLHCRRILYQLSSQGSPMYTYTRSFLDSFPI